MNFQKRFRNNTLYKSKNKNVLIKEKTPQSQKKCINVFHPCSNVHVQFYIPNTYLLMQIYNIIL